MQFKMPPQQQPTTEEMLLKAREKLAQAQHYIRAVQTPPFVYGTVVAYKPGAGSVDVSVSGKVMELSYAPDVENRLRVGRCVRLNPETYAVIGVRRYNGTGITTVVSEVLDDGRVVIESDGKRQVINTGRKRKKVEKGDRIITDPGSNVILENLGRENNEYSIAEVPVVPWSKIGGLEQTLDVIREAIEDPFIHREIYAKYQKRPPKGILLEGPPGCGKTLVAKAIVYNLSQRMKEQGTDGNGYFFSISGPELKNKWYGESESKAREIFETARKHAKARGDISVIFFDEAESTFKRRGDDLGRIDDSIVTQLLAEWDGIGGNENVLVVLATNRADILDDAVLRPGRVDRKIRIGRPNQHASEQIFQIHLNGMPIGNHRVLPQTTESLARYASSELFSSQYPLYHATFTDGTLEPICLGHLTSGAMIESIAQRAAGFAIKREIAKGNPGISKKDLEQGVRSEYEETRGLARISKEDLQATFRERFDSIENVQKVNGSYSGVA